MGLKKTFTGSSKEDAEQKAKAWLVSQKKKKLSKKTMQLMTPVRRGAPLKQKWETVVEYE